ncbi:MAG: copper amine oxidase N-terminal domain-containing protein [Defluviitaleaceae bacterium]|nr:copper amine oxidase N-terminal domain-containing protein [Defluviitaleaceae bacterium]
MKKVVKGYVAGVITTILLIAFATSAYAAARTQSISVTYNNIRLVINGTHVIPRDAQGNVVEPFIFGGTTFLPVRAVAEALGEEVRWDGNTQTVYVGPVIAPPPVARFFLESDVFATSLEFEEPPRSNASAFVPRSSIAAFTQHPASGSFVMNDITYHRGLSLRLNELSMSSSHTTTAYAIATYDTLGFARLSGVFGISARRMHPSGWGTAQGTLVVTCADTGRFLGGADVSHDSNATSPPAHVDIDISGIQRVQIRLQINATHASSVDIGFGDAYFR